MFLSAGGDPFIALLVLKLWKDHWYDEVDRFYIDYNNHSGVPQEVVSEFASRVVEDKKVHLISHPTGIGNGMPITEMTLISKEDLVMLLEDDGFIFTPGKVDRAFQQIESDLCDAVGSPRGSCGPEVRDAMQKKYNLDYSGYGDVGPNYWPNFFFCKRKDLLATDMNFSSKTWVAGEYSEELNHTFVEVNHGDTFVWANIQMWHNGVRFNPIPQYHASPTEIEDKRTKKLNWHKSAVPYWLHGGSLSAGWGGYLSGTLPPLASDSEKMEIESRVAFWTIAADVIEGFGEFKVQYKNGIANLTAAGLNPERIKQKIELYRGMMVL